MALSTRCARLSGNKQTHTHTHTHADKRYDPERATKKMRKEKEKQIEKLEEAAKKRKLKESECLPAADKITALGMYRQKHRRHRLCMALQSAK